jgi:hypothetical protein
MFKTIPDFPNYEIDEAGHVFSCFFNKRRELTWRRPTWNSISKCWGYFQVKISGKNGTKLKAVHRLVLQTFVGPCPEGMEARHLDGSKYNNHLSNLAWGTRQQNSGLDKIAHGTSNRGVRNGSSIFKPGEVELIAKLIRGNVPISIIKRIFKCGYNSIWYIKNGDHWSWLTGLQQTK